MYLVLILLPFINFILLLLFGRFIGKYGTIIITIISFLIALILTFLIAYEIILSNSICQLNLWNWVVLNEITINFGFLFDSLTCVMCLVVYCISSLVHLYSFGYMSNDPHFIRFISFLSLFTFFMILIVTANNFIQLFFGWELVGLASYLLINFWYTRILANKSALKAIIVNKIGDLGIILSIVCLYYITKSFDYVTIFNYLTYSKIDKISLIFFTGNNFISINLLILANFLLLIGVMAKSAQIGLHTWLVDAMEGPTPVSALLHAATMVTVGVFCLLRCNILLAKTPIVLVFIVFIGALTALFGSIVGLLQNDIKKVIAYSTCSQLGYMVCACGFNYNELALYHLTNHAFFKALLFLTAGGIIHVLNNKQDIREMGSLLKLQPILYISFFIGSFSLTGLPFFSGFFSKDPILELAYSNYFNDYSVYIYTILLVAAFFTAFYSIRLIFLTFFMKIKNVNKHFIKSNHSLSIYIIFPLILLSIFSVFSGWLLKDVFLGLGSDIFESSFFIHLLNYNLIFINVEFISVIFKNLPIIFIVLAFSIGIMICLNHINKLEDIYILKTKEFLNTNYIFQKKMFFDFIYYKFLINPFFFTSYDLFYKTIDRGFLEIIGPTGLTIKIFKIMKISEIFNTNNFYYFIMYLIQNCFIFLFLVNVFIIQNYNIFELLILLIILFNLILLKKELLQK